MQAGERMNQPKIPMPLDRSHPFPALDDHHSAQDDSELAHHAPTCQTSDEALKLYVKHLGVLGKRKQPRCLSQELMGLSRK
jgi:hypothetical protein